MKKFFISVLFIIFFLTVSGCISSQTGSTSEKGKIMYNKYNIHIQYKSADNITSHYANWTGPFAGHKIIPPNTQIKILPWMRGFIMVRMDTGQTIKFTYSERHMDMTKDMYLSTIFSPDAVSLGNLSSKDLKGVKQGKALKGMSKQGVMTALGYPAAHRTPSLDENEWIYWANRFKTKAVIFNESGKVSGFR